MRKRSIISQREKCCQDQKKGGTKNGQNQEKSRWRETSVVIRVETSSDAIECRGAEERSRSGGSERFGLMVKLGESSCPRYLCSPCGSHASKKESSYPLSMYKERSAGSKRRWESARSRKVQLADKLPLDVRRITRRERRGATGEAQQVP